MIINVSHQKGGTGKSTIVYHLTQTFVNKDFKVQLLDLDNQDSCISVNELRDVPHKHIKSISDDESLIKAIEEKKDGEIIIIDSGGFDSSLTRLAIMAADINITPVADKVMDLLAVIKKYSLILQQIEEATKEDTKTYILLKYL